MTFLGIDPGLAAIGWGIVDRLDHQLKVIDYGVITTNSQIPVGERLVFIHEQLVSLLMRYQPDLCGIETLFFSKNISSALPVAQARGVLLFTLQMHQLQVVELAPNEVKKSVVGIAKAKKEQVSEMIRFILGLKEVPNPSHAADALAIAYCAANLKSIRYVS